MNVAILGANGFVGYRLFESWQLRGPHRPRAVVRSPASLARVARFAADWRLADATDEAALTQALAGCDAVVHCVVGDERVIVAATDPVVRAAARAGVRKLIYLSSASVHGQNPPPSTTDESPLREEQPFAYNTAKIRAEQRLRALSGSFPVQIVMLRPGIVWGPRSRWIADPVEALPAGRAAWIDGGRGICNSIHVDNLVHAIECALVAEGVNAQAFYVGDPEVVTWRRLYLGVSEALGYTERDWCEARPTAPQRAARLSGLKSTPAVQAVLPWFSPRLKESVKDALARWQRPQQADPFALPVETRVIAASPEMTLLFACQTALSDERARRLLAYRPPIDFAAGLANTARWLATVYPKRTGQGT